VLVDATISDGADGMAARPQETAEQFKMFAIYQEHQREYLTGMMHAIINKPQSDGMIERLVGTGMKTPPDVGVAMLVADMFGPNRTPALKKVDCPTLIIASAKSDELARQQAAANQISHARFEKVEDSAHAVFLDQPDRFSERMRELAEDQAASEDEFELSDTGRVFRGSTLPVARPDGSLVGRIWTLREVTADRRLERLRDAFVAAVSHELRTPLTSVSGFLELLGDEADSLPLTGRTYLTAARRGTDRLQRIVEDLLLVAQIEAGLLELHPEPVDLAELAADAVEDAGAAAAEKRVAISLDTEGPLPLEADAARLRQVLDNLLSNAIKYTPTGGAVVVSTTDSEGQRRIEIADNGIGVPHDELGQLFSRFYRASSATRLAIPGTGLGLVIVRAIVEHHGGTVSLDSVENEGTRVTVSLPVAQSDGGTYR